MWYYRLIACLTALDLIGKSAIEGLPDDSFPREMPDGKPVLLLKKFQNRGLPLGFLEKRREAAAGRVSRAVPLLAPLTEARAED